MLESEEKIVKKRGRPKKIEVPQKENTSPMVVNSATETISEFSSDGEILSAKAVDEILRLAGDPVYFVRDRANTFIEPKLDDSLSDSIDRTKPVGDIINLTQNDKIIHALECAKQEYDKSKNDVETALKRAKQSNDKIMNMAERAFEYAKQGDDLFDSFIKAGSSFMKDFVSRYGKDIGILHNQLFTMNKIFMYATKELAIGDIMFDYSNKMKLDAFFVICYFPEENILHFYQNEIKTTNKWYCFAKIPN